MVSTMCQSESSLFKITNSILHKFKSPTINYAIVFYPLVLLLNNKRITGNGWCELELET